MSLCRAAPAPARNLRSSHGPLPRHGRHRRDVLRFRLSRRGTGEITITKVPSTPDDPSRAILAGRRGAARPGRARRRHRLFLPRHHGRHQRAARRQGRPDRPAGDRGLSRHLRGRRAGAALRRRRSSTSCTTSRRCWCRRACTGEVQRARRFPRRRAARRSTRRRCATTVRELAAQKHRVARGVPAVLVPASASTRSACARSSPRKCRAAASRCRPRSLPQIREYYRLSTTVINAYLQPILARYIAQSRPAPRRAPASTTRQKYIMQSNGGMATFAAPRARRSTTVLSGPAGGVTAGALCLPHDRLAEHHHLRHGRHLLRRRADQGRRAARRQPRQDRGPRHRACR